MEYFFGRFMDKGIGVGFAAVAAEVLAFAGSAVLAAALRVPGVVAAVVAEIALRIAEGSGDAVLAVGELGTIERPTAHLGSEVGTGDAEDLSGHNVVDALLQVWDLRFQPSKQPLGNLAQKDTTLRTGIEKASLRTVEQLLRQQIEHTVGQLRRGKDLVAAEVGQAVQYVR